MSKKSDRPVKPLRTFRYYSFIDSSKAKLAFDQARRYIENYFFMDPADIVTINDKVVGVPDWFPKSPNPEWLAK